MVLIFCVECTLGCGLRLSRPRFLKDCERERTSNGKSGVCVLQRECYLSPNGQVYD